MMLVALTASSVHEEAMDGFEAIRGALRHPMAQEEERMVSPQISNSVLLIAILRPTFNVPFNRG